MEGRDSSAASSPTMALAKKPIITSLPFEILRTILWCDELTQCDVEAARLTCRALAPAAADRLFFRIYVSKLVADRDSFLAICNSPHLAIHVREVEWLEISYALGGFKRVHLDKSVGWRTAVEGDDSKNIYRCFDTACRQLFWLFNAPVHRGDLDGSAIEAAEAARRQAVATFRPVFEAAVDKLANLHSFVSRPMTSSRIVSDLEYPIPAWQFQCFQNRTEYPVVPQTNDGLFLLILPAMDRPTSAVRRLRWHDEFPGFSFLRPFSNSAFRNLESLELTLTEVREDEHTEPHEMGGLKDALIEAAPSIRHFKLSLDDACIHMPDNHLGARMVRYLSGPHCALRSLSLESMGLSTDLLFRVIKANAASLRHLSLGDVPVYASLFKRLAQVPGLQLASIQLTQSEQLWVVEGSKYCYPGDDESDNNEWYSDESDNDESDNDEAMSTDSTPPGIELVTEGALLRYLRGEPPTCDDDERVQDLISYGNPILLTAPWTEEKSIMSDCSSESDPDSLDHRRRNGPRWLWGRYFNGPDSSDRGQVFCFRGPETSQHGHPTTTWKFTSRDGEVGYGDNPLEWFEEWDLKAGDKEEPTPYCNALRDFVAAEGQAPGLSNIPEEVWNFMRHLRPPMGAMEYDEEEASYVDDI